MTKVFCPCLECVNNKDSRCKAMELHFRNRSVFIANEGRSDVWVCDQYQLTDSAKDFVKQIKALIGEGSQE